MPLTELLALMVTEKLSDLHCLVGLPPTIRKNGKLHAVADVLAITTNGLANDIKSILPPEVHARYIQERTVDTSYTLPDGSRFRLNVYFEKASPALAARYIPASIPALESLNLPPIIDKFLEFRSGIVLVTGPTGCGKTTLLASMLEHINLSRSEHIVTFEDPIEFIFTPKQSIISQLQHGRDFLTFESALKHALRQDPNIVLIGEMRDLETMGAALTLAETGHLVFATLHTNSAAQTVERIVNAFPPYQQSQVRLQLALVLRGVISQLLLTGQDGNLSPAREILVNNTAIAHLIIEGKTEQIPNVILSSAVDGMQTLDQDLISMVEANLITPDLAQKYSNRPKQFEGMEGQEETTEEVAA